jgi:tetratricopeptide (TPR) repeat protein
MWFEGEWVMKTHSRNNLLLLAGMAAGFCATTCGPTASAQEVRFFDGGYAEICSTAAHNIDDPLPVEITGTRLDKSPLEICTLAIRSADNSSNRAGSYNNRGVLLFAQGAAEEALRDFEEAIRVDDGLAQAHVNRGYVLMSMERWEESITAFDHGIALGSSDLPKVHYNRGIAHEELGHVREAYQDYLKASELDPLYEEPKRELTRFTVRRK